MIKFNKHNIVDTETKAKARVFYSLDGRIDDKLNVTIYAKDYDNDLDILFPDNYKNDTDIMTDYFEKGSVVLFEDHPLYAKARIAAERTSK